MKEALMRSRVCAKVRVAAAILLLGLLAANALAEGDHAVACGSRCASQLLMDVWVRAAARLGDNLIASSRFIVWRHHMAAIAIGHLPPLAHIDVIGETSRGWMVELSEPSGTKHLRLVDRKQITSVAVPSAPFGGVELDLNATHLVTPTACSYCSAARHTRARSN